LANPVVGLLFLIPCVDETLRVGGRAEIRTDAELRESFRTDAKLPLSVLVIHVQRAYLHCAKALMRSKLWCEDAKLERAVLPTLGEMLKEQLNLTEPPESRGAMERRYRSNLY